MRLVGTGAKVVHGAIREGGFGRVNVFLVGISVRGSINVYKRLVAYI